MNNSAKNSTIPITDRQIDIYANKMTSPESTDLEKVVKSSARELEFIDMLCGNTVGQLLKMLIRLCKATRILEIGTFTGYSALAMAEALPDKGEIVTLEMNVLYQELALRHFEQYDKQGKITLLKGDAKTLLDDVQGKFDLIFLDADKLNYALYYKKVLPMLNTSGLLVTDNTLWGGTVLKPEEPKAKAIDDFNRLVKEDRRVNQVLLPVRDGITLIQKNIQQ